MRTPTLVIISYTLCLLLQDSASAQFNAKVQPDRPVDAETTARLIGAISQELRSEYVFPDVAQKMAQDLESRLEKKEYEKITSAAALAQKLTEHLQLVSHDKHLHVNYSNLVLPPEPKEEGEQPDATARQAALARAKAQGASRNFGFEKVERLDGNVGYISLRGFMPAEVAGQAAADAMSSVADTEALIIDLRSNGGGAPSMVTLLCSYLFSPDPVHLNDMYSRPKDTTRQWWTLPYLPGERYESKPVYVLTSGRTFSAAEEFAYNLKHLKRATIVGETTGGGAHPGGRKRLDDHFYVFLPTGRPTNPITKTNWEGTGVIPDITVPADLALKTAHLEALKTIIPESEARVERLKETRAALEHELRDVGQGAE